MDDTNNATTGQVNNDNQQPEVNNSDKTPGSDVKIDLLNTETQKPASGSFIDNLSDGYKNDPNITKFKTVDDLAKSYTELSKMIGKDKVVLPTGEGEEYDRQLNDLYSKLGRPEKPEGYELKEIDLSQYGINEKLDLKDFSEVAHKSGLTTKQVNNIIDYYVKDIENSQRLREESSLESVAKSQSELRKEYGAKFDENMSFARKTFKEYFPSLQGTDLTRNANFVRDLVKLSKNFRESVVGETPDSGTKTPSEAKAEKLQIMQSEAYTNPLHTEHQSAVERYRALLAMEMTGK